MGRSVSRRRSGLLERGSGLRERGGLAPEPTARGGATPRRVVLPALLVVGLAACAGIRTSDLVTPRPLPEDARCVVVGFLGGRDAWNDADKGVRRLALELRDRHPGIYAETFENRSRDVAARFVRQAFDRDGDGHLEEGELPGGPERARLILYGQSFGGDAVVEFSRRLRRFPAEATDGARGAVGSPGSARHVGGSVAETGEGTATLPIALTVQIDSVGIGDRELPPNVRNAANLYQDDGWLIEGEHPIRAEDASATRILGDWEFEYDRPPGSEIEVGDLPFWKLLFRVAHAKMDRDPRVWELTGRLIRRGCAGRLDEVAGPTP